MLSSAEPRGDVVNAVDRGLLDQLSTLEMDCTRSLEEYDYARALQNTESFFWSLCDDYLELVKARRYGDHGAEGAGSANTTLLHTLSVVTRLFAPFLPFVAEEVWSWWQPGSVHSAPWPTGLETTQLLGSDGRGAGLLTLASAREVLAEVRRQKSLQKRPLKALVASAVLTADAAYVARLSSVEADLKAAANVREFRYVEGNGPMVELNFETEL